MARIPPVTNDDLRLIADLADEHIGALHALLHRLEAKTFDGTPDIGMVNDIAQFGCTLSQLAVQLLFRLRMASDNERFKADMEQALRAQA